MISFRFQKPISTNALFRNVSGRGRIKTSDYVSWQDQVGWGIKLQLAKQTEQIIAGPFSLSIWIPKGIDLDNSVKAIADLIGPVKPKKKCLGITDDDRHMRELHVYRHADHDCRVEIMALPEIAPPPSSSKQA